MSAPISALAILAQQAHFAGRGNPPHASFVGAKSRSTSFMSNKNKPGHKAEHTEALVDNAAFVPTPKPESTPEPVAPATDFAPEPEPVGPSAA